MLSMARRTLSRRSYLHQRQELPRASRSRRHDRLKQPPAQPRRKGSSCDTDASACTVGLAVLLAVVAVGPAQAGCPAHLGLATQHAQIVSASAGVLMARSTHRAAAAGTYLPTASSCRSSQGSAGQAQRWLRQGPAALRRRRIKLAVLRTWGHPLVASRVQLPASSRSELLIKFSIGLMQRVRRQSRLEPDHASRVAFRSRF